MRNELNRIMKEPKERILETAAELFAIRGYSSVGVREIAKQANVNVAMISYYFTNKSGILKEIIRRYFQEIRAILEKAKVNSYSLEDVIKFMVNEIVYLMKHKPVFCKVAITEMPFNLPEFADFKAEAIRMHVDFIMQSLEIANLFVLDPKYHLIIGPAIISLIFSHFLFSPVIKKALNIETDNEFFERYAQTISTLLLDGLKGLKNMIELENQVGDKK